MWKITFTRVHGNRNSLSEFAFIFSQFTLTRVVLHVSLPTYWFVKHARATDITVAWRNAVLDEAPLTKGTSFVQTRVCEYNINSFKKSWSDIEIKIALIKQQICSVYFTSPIQQLARLWIASKKLIRLRFLYVGFYCGLLYLPIQHFNRLWIASKKLIRLSP